MKIVTIGNSKGGVGKSTIATNLAVCAVKNGKKTLLVDADIQGSAQGFRSLRETDDVKCVSITSPTLNKDLKDFASYHLIVVDAGGRDSKVFRSAVAAADLLIIPVLPSVYDVWAASDTIDVLKEIRVAKDIEARILLNMLMPNTIMGRETLDALEDYSEDAPLLESKIHARASFKNCVAKGLGVVEFEPKSKAADEMRSLYNEITAGQMEEK